jgi:basic amino acid/polyamine antiporter, APA family
MTRDRPLTLLPAVALVVSSMIGTGVFTTTGFMLESLRSPALVLGAWVCSGLIALAGAAVYAELGAMMPRAGGEYVYLSRAFHPVVGFLSGWIALFVGFAAPMAASALACARYVHDLAPGLSERGVALALVALVTGLHAWEVKRAGLVQTALTGLVVVVIVVFIVAGLGAHGADWRRLVAHDERAPTSMLDWAGALAVALLYTTYSYCGWNGAAYVAGEIRDPQRTLPRALIGGTALVTLLYVALNAVFIASAPASQLAATLEVGHVAASALFGARGATLLTALIALALAGSVSALGMTGPRVVKAMADDGAFFRALGRTNERGAPSRAVLLQGALAALGVATAKFEPLLLYAGFTLSLSAAATVLGAFVLRRREPDAPRPHRALAWPWSGVAFLAMAAFMTVVSVRERPLVSLASLATLAAGGAAWALWHRRRA